MHATIPRRSRPATLALLAPLALAHALPLAAFEELNAAQTLIYDTPHLSASAAGDELDYAYTASVGDEPPVEDRARLSVTAAAGEERRDVTLEFLSEERALVLPPFEGYRTNPVLIAMLEHVAQSLGAQSGGGALYFRNRIRDAFAGEDVAIEREEIEHAGERVASTSLSFAPFVADPYLGELPGFGGATFRIVLSEAAPGGVLGIEARSAEADDVPSDVRFAYTLRLAEQPARTPR